MDTTTRTERDATGVEILSKAAAAVFVLEAHGELTAQQIAEQVGEPVSSTYRLLSQLTALGWVERGSRRGLFRLGLMFLRVGGVVEDRIDIRTAALPALSGLRRATGSTSFLCVRRGARAACIERLESGDVRSQALRLGDSLSLDSGAPSLAILAFLPRGERDAFIGQVAETAGGAASSALTEGIARARERGFALSDGDVTPGIAVIAAPVYNHRGELAASISVSGLRDRIVADLARSSRLVRGAADATSAALGRRVHG